MLSPLCPLFHLTPTATLQAGYFDPYFSEEENVGLREVK